MIPSKYLEELKTAPVDEVDFVATFIEVIPHQISHVVFCCANKSDVRGQIYYHG